MRFNVVFRLNSRKFPVKFKAIQTVTARKDAEYYDGAYEVTPKRTKQVLPTSGKAMSADIIVHAIPQEYGLVTYDQNGSITIS